MKRILLSVLTLLITAATVHAATFYTPVGVTSPNSTVYADYVLANLHQGPGTGYSATEPHNAPTNETGVAIGGPGYNWVTIAPDPVADYYTAFPAPVLIIDLGENRLLSEISVWGYSAGNTNGLKDFTLRFATAAEGAAGFGTSISYNPSFEALFDPVLRDSNPFSQTVTARYVEMTITDNWAGLQGATPGGDRVGVGEIAFAVIPEPSAALLALGGLTLLPFRRKRHA